jgi:hypothetical protein
VFATKLKEFAADLDVLSRERFGPAGLVISYQSVEEPAACTRRAGR